MIVRIRDLMAAEERLDSAEEALHKYENTPALWAAHESVDDVGRRSLHTLPEHWQKVEQLQQAVVSARSQLLVLQKAFGDGGDE